MASPTLYQAHQHILAGEIDLADAALNYALREGADRFDVASLRAGLAMRQRDFDVALVHLSKALSVRPLDWTAHYNRGLCLYELGRFAEAVDAHRQSLKCNMQHAKTWLKLAGNHLVLQHWAEAMACYERGLALAPDDAELHIGYGTIALLFDDMLTAEREYRAALKLNPDAFEAEIALGFALLKDGKWKEGWRRFEKRSSLRPFGAPWDYKPRIPWVGKPDDMAGKRVLVQCEQGYGDTIHFCRYLPMIPGDVTVIAPPPIARLLASMGGITVIEQSDGAAHLPDHDIYTAMMSLPCIFGTTTQNAPSPASFHVEPHQLGARIGVCWAGGPRPEDPLAHADDKRRSVVLPMFQQIIDATAGTAISLQFEDLQGLGVADWWDTAAIIAGLELVITVDTAVAHLAASLGVETWMLSRAGGCWRWLAVGDKTVWYPSMTIYRQQILGEWGPVVDQVAGDVREWVIRG